MSDEDPYIAIAFDDKEVRISFDFDENFPIPEESFVNAVARLILKELQ